MKKLTKEFKDKSKQVLEQEVFKLREEIVKESIEFNVSVPKNTNLLFIKKKKLAVLLTLLNQKKS